MVFFMHASQVCKKSENYSFVPTMTNTPVWSKFHKLVQCPVTPWHRLSMHINSTAHEPPRQSGA